MSGAKAPHVSPKVGAGVPGDSSRSRMNQAAGQKVASAAGKPTAATKSQSVDKVAVASGDNMVMPVDHPSATSTRVTTKGGTL